MMLYVGRAPQTDKVWIYKCRYGHERILTKSDAERTDLRRCEQCDYEAARHVVVSK